MRKLIIGRLCAFIASIMFVATQATGAELKTDEEKMFYFLGTQLARNLTQLKLSDEELNLVISGMREQVKGEAAALDDAIYSAMLNNVAQERMAAGAADEAAAAEIYIEKMASEDGAIKTESGLVYLEITPGTGSSPTANSVVTAHYHGTLRDGTVFDSSVQRDKPFTSPLGKVIPCWVEAMQIMKEGGKSKVTCPPALAYGPRGSGDVPGGAALTFEVELIEVAK
jgi:FKBP-type peptidyl-prolyl cis-trans isomerase FkpA